MPSSELDICKGWCEWVVANMIIKLKILSHSSYYFKSSLIDLEVLKMIFQYSLKFHWYAVFTSFTILRLVEYTDKKNMFKYESQAYWNRV